MTVDDRNQISKLLAHVQAMAHQSKQVAMDGSNWRKLLDELDEATKLVVPINNALRKAGTHVYLVSDEPLPDDVAAYDNEEGASQDCWDRGMSGADVAIMTLPLWSMPNATLTTGRE